VKIGSRNFAKKTLTLKAENASGNFKNLKTNKCSIYRIKTSKKLAV